MAGGVGCCTSSKVVVLLNATEEHVGWCSTEKAAAQLSSRNVMCKAICSTSLHHCLQTKNPDDRQSGLLGKSMGMRRTWQVQVYSMGMSTSQDMQRETYAVWETAKSLCSQELPTADQPRPEQTEALC